MRARHRHFNARDAGAVAVYDARFLAGSNNSAVTDWEDRSRSGYTASQATSAERPTLQHAVQGGSNVVRFDGSDDELLTTSYALPSAASLVSVAKANAWQQTATYRPIATHAYNTGTDGTRGLGFCYLAPNNAGGSYDWNQYDVLFIGSGFQTASTPRAIGPIASGTDFRVISAVLGSSTARAWSNGAQVSTRKESTGALQARSDQFVIGGKKATTEQWHGDIGCLVYFHSEVSNSLRKRIEHAGAFSWKLSCN